VKNKTIKITKNIITNILSFVILISGVVLMIIGIFRGEPEDIMRKAIVVCLECIGIG